MKSLLIEAKNILATPGCWCKKVYAQDKDGNPCDATTERAHAFCARGVIMYVCRERKDDMYRRLTNHLYDTRKNKSIVDLNDYALTVDPVLELFDEAIALCKD